MKFSNAQRELAEKNIVIDALKFEIATLRTRLERTDRQWNKTIDELERLKQMPEVHKAIYGIK